jgi:hypothetical protein
MTYGLLLLLAYLTTNIIWLSLMITSILCEPFLYTLNLTLFPLCQKNLLMSQHNLAAPSKPSSTTMVVSSITSPLMYSLPPKGYFCGCLALTVFHRMVKPSTSSAPLVICCARYCVEGFHTATYLLNRLPTKAISTISPYFALHGVAPPMST